MIRNSLLLFLLFIAIKTGAQLQVAKVGSTQHLYQGDWLVKPVEEKASIYKSSDNRDIILSNGLVKRTFRLSPNVACTDYKNMITGQQLLGCNARSRDQY
jgi:hypothetical protein